MLKALLVFAKAAAVMIVAMAAVIFVVSIPFGIFFNIVATAFGWPMLNIVQSFAATGLLATLAWFFRRGTK